jgi:hypothetical protein
VSDPVPVITADSLASMSIRQCLEQGEEQQTNAKAAEAEAKKVSKSASQQKEKAQDAKRRAMACYRNHGACLREANRKADAEGVPWEPLLKQHCKRIGKSDRTASDYMRLSDNWDRVENYVSQRSATAAKRKPPISIRAFIKLVEVMDGKRGDMDTEPVAEVPAAEPNEPQQADETPLQHWRRATEEERIELVLECADELLDILRLVAEHQQKHKDRFDKQTKSDLAA